MIFINFILLYLSIGLSLAILINILCWVRHMDTLKGLELLACIIVWPKVIASFIEQTKGIE